MKRLLLALVMVMLPVIGEAATVSFSWNASASGNPTGYKLLYGTTPGGPYTTTVDVGNVLTSTVNIPQPGTYYVVAVAYNAICCSPYSNEVAVQVLDPRCVFPTGDMSVSVFPTGKVNYTGSGGPGSRAWLTFQIASPGSPVTHIAIRSNGNDISPMDDLEGTKIGAIAGAWFSIPSASGMYPLSILATNQYGCTTEKATGLVVTVP